MQSPYIRVLGFLPCLAVLIAVPAACSPASASEADYESAWAASAHADAESASFTRWDDEQPAVIPPDCAKCHSTPGYLDFLGADGSTSGEVSQAAPVGTTIECDVCHDGLAEARQYADMPSGLRISGLGQESNCMECHQGRSSAVHVAEAIEGLPRDTVDSGLSLPNIHNNAAGASYYGDQARGGGEYFDSEYWSKFYHGFDDCTTCHDSHTLEVRVANCSACHLGASTLEGVRDIRLSRIDYDGDGDTAEGLSGEIETMLEKLLVSIQLNALGTEGAGAIEYDDGFVDQAGEAYSTWTPTLMQAAYNYHYTVKDPGIYAHNPRYALQLLYDSIDDLGGSTLGMTRPGAD